MARIGFVGLGNMGGPMARNLVRAGHEVKGFDVSEEALQFATQAGVKGCASARDAATEVEVAITMLPVGDNVREAVLAGGMLEAVADGTLMIDCSTIDVDTARALHEAASARGLAMLDAPVSGGTMGADQGTLTFMCGGSKEAFDRARPVLQGMGRNIVHCGGPGAGQVTKICNNMIVGATYCALAEAFVMGEALGVDRQVLFDVISTSSGNSFLLENACPVPGPVPHSAAARDFAPGFAATLMLKDMRLSQAAAQSAGTATSVTAAATAAFQMHVNNGNGHLDASSISRLLDPGV